MTEPSDHKMQLVHTMRALTVAFGLQGEAFAKRNSLNGIDLRAIIELLDASRAGDLATPGWLGERLALNSASVTALVDRLERTGHVRRTRDTADRRRVLLTVSDSANDLGWAFFGPLIRQMVVAMDEYTADELDTVDRFLHSMIQAVEKPEDGS